MTATVVSQLQVVLLAALVVLIALTLRQLKAMQREGSTRFALALRDLEAAELAVDEFAASRHATQLRDGTNLSV